MIDFDKYLLSDNGFEEFIQDHSVKVAYYHGKVNHLIEYKDISILIGKVDTSGDARFDQPSFVIRAGIHKQYGHKLSVKEKFFWHNWFKRKNQVLTKNRVVSSDNSELSRIIGEVISDFHCDYIIYHTHAGHCYYLDGEEIRHKKLPDMISLRLELSSSHLHELDKWILIYLGKYIEIYDLLSQYQD